VRQAKEFGAEGIGLCRSEHMFFDADRIAVVREMILAETKAARVAALDKLLPFQRADFKAMMEIMDGLPCTIRLLDPPLHEFLPHTEEDCIDVAAATGVDAKTLLARARELHEVNPMLGFRGCRLAIAFPEIYDMQVRAIFEAAAEVALAGGKPKPEVMVPFVFSRRELAIIKARIHALAKTVMAEKKAELSYLVGTMIELPRAALLAGEIAQEAEFFSFGTNDLTQTTLGVSRDDSGKFLGAYVEQGILEKDPFVSIDQDGVGEMIRTALERGRKARPGIKTGICGEHGGDPASVAFCEGAGLDYVSCSPFRVPIARLAAAHAALQK
jgi:pyruvate,orthophosphate dikinase